MPLRRTIVVHTRLAGHMARVQAARAGESGVQILTMGQLAARLAGGLLRPIDPDDLKIAVRDSLAAMQLGELEPIKALRGQEKKLISMGRFRVRSGGCSGVTPRSRKRMEQCSTQKRVCNLIRTD